MEREITFRGKRLDNGEWVEGHLLSFKAGQINPNRSFILQFASSVGVSLGAYTFGGFVEVDPSTVGQYTGLTDKNGKKIFEGDIVLKRTYNGKRAFPVTFTDGMFHAGYGGGSSTAAHPYTLDDRQIEVIGNRWDNPELLEVTK